MPATVVILSCPHDTHAHAMCEALERKGAKAEFIYTPDFPERLGLTITPTAQGARLVSHGSVRAEFGSECTSVWTRRTYFGKTLEEFEERDRKTIERECRDMRLSFFDLLCPAALWVNPLHCNFTDRCKPTQLVVARRCGLRVPPTLISNEPDEISAFVNAVDGPVVYKTFNSLVPTTVVTDDMLAEPEILRWTPGIFQHYVNKDHELRVTVIGHQLFVVRINSQQTARGKVDWRDAQLQPRGQVSDLTFEPDMLPPPIERACRRLIQELGLAYGAIDLIVTPEQEYVFLEVNASGQFLWIDSEVGLPLLDAMSEMLIQGKLDYEWDPCTPRVRADLEFFEAVETRQRRSMVDHVSDIMTW